MFNILNDYVTAKLAASNARKAANTAIATEGDHTLPEACDREAIHKAFTSLARSNKNARAIVDGLDGAAIFAEAEKERQDKRDRKAREQEQAFNDSFHARLDLILSSDKHRAMLIAEAQAAEELAAQAAQSGEVAATA